MTMPMKMAQNLVRGCIEQVRTCTPNRAAAQLAAGQLTLKALGETRDRLQRLIGGGYRLDRLQSTLILCNEMIRQQHNINIQIGQQNARLQALLSGLNEVQ